MKIINMILTIIGLFVIASASASLVITMGIKLLSKVKQTLSPMESKQTRESMNDNCESGQSCIYIPNYIKKLRCFIPQLKKTRYIKPTKQIPDLKDGDAYPYIEKDDNQP